MVVGSGSSWLVYIRCSAQALKTVRTATESVVQPIVDKLFLQSFKKNSKKVVYFCTDEKVVKTSADPFTLLSNLGSAIYGHQSLSSMGVDARLLLPVTTSHKNNRLAFDSVEKVLLCQSGGNNNDNKHVPESTFSQLVGRQFSFSSPEVLTSYDTVTIVNNNNDDNEDGGNISNKCGYRQHEEVCLGGTFDRLHGGHKQLLTAGCLACSHRLTVGVLTGPMIERKTLFELIEPVENRIASVINLLKDIDPSVEANVVPIIDAFGPAVVIEKLGLLVISKETMRGGERVNEERVKRGLTPAQLYAIELLGDIESIHLNIGHSEEDTLDGEVPKPPVEEESKYSSSTQRFHLLGELLRPPYHGRSDDKAHPDSRPYVVGLSGGIGSGKTSVSKRLEKLGAVIIDCDHLGHEIYQKNNPAFSEIVSRFGNAIVNESTGEIDRRKLGSIVFGDKVALRDLCSITWPRIAERLFARIDEIALSDEQYNKDHADAPKRRSVIVVNAAVLFEANWDNYFNEIWLCAVPLDTELKRVMARDKLPENDARERIASQMSNIERVSRSHVVISTVWRRSVTQYQVQKAWKLLQERLQCQ